VNFTIGLSIANRPNWIKKRENGLEAHDDAPEDFIKSIPAIVAKRQ
jgi:hypothetical protein